MIQFDVRQLPEIPGQVLVELRRELPAKLAASSRIVPTHGMWDAGQPNSADGFAPEHGVEWAAVDSRTMEHRHFTKMQRQAMHGMGAETAPDHAPAIFRSKRACALSDRRGRVNIDYRSVGILSAFVSEGGKIMSRRKSHLSAKAQRKMARSVKSARQMALLAPDPLPGPTMDDFRAAAEAME